MLDTAIRQFCRNQKLAQPAESPRKAFCARGCHASLPDQTQLDRVRTEKQKAKKKSGDFTDDDRVRS